jgi:hypothetical protein
MSVEWDYPEPREGLAGQWDTFIGPGATKAESALMLGLGLAAGLLLLVYQYIAGLGWDILQQIVAALLTFDLVGGVVSNSTSATKRWYHREGQGFKEHMGFIAFHFIHPLLIVIFFMSFDWIYFALIYGYLIVSAMVVLLSPLYIRRPVSIVMFLGALVANIYLLIPAPGFEWFVPVLFLKLIVGHAVKEEPYRPREA